LKNLQRLGVLAGMMQLKLSTLAANVTMRDCKMSKENYEYEQQKKQQRKQAAQWRKRSEQKRSQWNEKDD
jgi:flagellar biosynthesis component FlhA